MILHLYLIHFNLTLKNIFVNFLNFVNAPHQISFEVFHLKTGVILVLVNNTFVFFLKFFIFFVKYIDFITISDIFFMTGKCPS